MEKFKRFMPKLLSLGLSFVIICSLIAVNAYSAGAESAGVKADSSASANSKVSKEETVYVIADAEGNPSKVIVSDWVKNPAKLDTINDKTDLKDIKNLKGDEEYTLNGDNLCIWDAQGNDIYYQGTSKKDIPVDMSVSYRLDGKSVSPDELAGKSGRVTMRFDYNNKQYEYVTVNGKKTKIYVPFVMLTGMILDNDNFSNVTVNNGKIINDGSHTVVAGFATPGLEEDLALESDEIEFPNYVEIKADVKDFKLTTAMTVATNDVFSDIDFSKADKAIDKLDKKLDKLTDATDKLIDGSSKLYKGLSTLLSKSDDLISGVKSLVNGAKKLSAGASALDKGAAKLNNGAKKLDKGAGSLKMGINSLQAGVTKLAQGLGTLSSNSYSLNSGAKQVFETLLSTADSQIAAAGLKAEKLTIDNYSKVLSGITDSLSEEAVNKLAYNTALETVTATVKAQESLIKTQVEAAVKEQVLEGVLKKAGLEMTAAQYNAAVAAGKIDETVKAQINSAVEEQMKTDEIKATVTAKTNEQIQNLIDENMKTDAVKSQIEDAVKKAKSGSDAISKLKTQLDSYNKFYQGVLSYTSGVDSAKSGADQLDVGSAMLSKGAGDLKSGTKTLKKGTKSLKNGTKELSKGTITLTDGVKKLYSGSGALVSGVKLLNDGSLTLTNGLKTYKQQGVDKLVDAVNGDVKGLVCRLKAISKVSSNYKSFSGIGSGMDGKVDFIYKTDSIEKK